MSTADVQKLQQDLQNELTIANQLLRLISMELKKIKLFTNPGAELEATIKQNASMMAALANMQQIDILNLPPVIRGQVAVGQQSNQNMSQFDHQRDSMDESQ